MTRNELTLTVPGGHIIVVLDQGLGIFHLRARPRHLFSGLGFRV